MSVISSGRKTAVASSTGFRVWVRTGNAEFQGRDGSQKIAEFFALGRGALQIPPAGRDDKGRVDWNRKVCYSDGEKLRVLPSKEET